MYRLMTLLDLVTKFVIVACFSTSSAFSFDWGKCKRGMIDTRGEGYSSSIISGVSNASISSIQFMTSTGGCAMVGEVSQSRRVFIAYNLDKVQVDAARGSGEYLSILASLYSCSPADVQVFSKNMQQHYQKTFSSNEAEAVLEKIDLIISNQKTSVGSCKV